MRGRINHTRSCLRIMDLWESTHDLSKVLTFAHDTLPWIEAHGTADEVRSWRLATFEIYIKADRADLARDALLKLQKAGSSQMESVSLASLLLAKKGAWEALERLLTIAEEADEFALDIDAAARFNDTLRLYTNEHTAVESWQFVTRAIDKLGFLPDHITTEVMLKAFISTNNIRMVPKWLRYVHTLGREFELTAKVASRLLTLFYRNNRPSHAIMMWLCRNLTVSAPSLAGPHFVNVIKDSIGFDIRKAGAGLIWRRSVGRARLAALSDSTGALPAPGYSWNGQLYFEHPSKTGPAMENVNVTCAEPLQASAQAVGLSPNAEAAAELRPSVIATSEDSAEKQNAADLEESHTSSHQTAKLSDRPKAADDFATDMTLALSLGRYERVLDLYHSSLNTVGLPISPLALEIALEACLRQNRGNSTAAEALLSSAKAAGMNITCAMGPMLIHKMYHLKASDKKDVNNLRLSVIDYYRMNDEHAWPVKHNVGIQAANLLIDGGKPHHGINILDAIFHSKWAAKRPLDIVAMTVFFKGYAAVQSFDGLKWVVNTVLEQNMRIDAKFLQTLKTVSKDFARDLSIEAFRRRDSTYRGTMSAPSLWIKLCQGRRARQKHENMVIGRELVACLAKCANEQSQPEIDATSRHALENELFGKRMKPVEAALGTDEIPAPGDGRRARGWESYKLRTARAVRADPALGLRRPRGRTNTSYSRTWVKQYRAYLRKRLIMPDGKLASFRWGLSPEVENVSQ
ncbi:hypothetical protein B0A50_03224 [Salinomyces thailandicus]|uniref:Pentatricopeptide repeat protein n=1 Tax=Salinomyces thailandicus TaxID=706561 RepID=A0A4U0U441_9PEZI|nr:hypothetical protein B0A50_03224 [Salinomyces thailandica]